MRLEDRFFAVALSRPQAIAVAFATNEGWKEWTYRELAHRARAIAIAMTRLGVTRDQPVGVTCQRHPDTLAGMLGILAAGACYPPLGSPVEPEVKRM